MSISREIIDNIQIHRVIRKSFEKIGRKLKNLGEMKTQCIRIFETQKKDNSKKAFS